ncbi:MAG: hypothetical protein R3F11_28360 [Verrucomicrobiales bacterium]
MTLSLSAPARSSTRPGRADAAAPELLPGGGSPWIWEAETGVLAPSIAAAASLRPDLAPLWRGEPMSARWIRLAEHLGDLQDCFDLRSKSGLLDRLRIETIRPEPRLHRRIVNSPVAKLTFGYPESAEEGGGICLAISLSFRSSVADPRAFPSRFSF